MRSATIRSAMTQAQVKPEHTGGAKCPHCGGVKPQDLAVDAMIERARQMAPKPFKREPIEPDPVPRQPADNTAVRRKRY